MESERTEYGVLEHWTPEEAAEAHARDEIVLIDVRTPQEFTVERIEGALLSDYTSATKGRRATPAPGPRELGEK